MRRAAELEGKVAIVTGAGAGMGRAHALLLAARGADIVVQDIDAASAGATAEAIRTQGRRAVSCVYDIGDAAASRGMAERTLAELGRIDILVNNAGIGGQNAVIEAIDEARFDRMFSVHARGMFFCGQAVMPAMREQRDGRIINTASRWFMTGHETSSHYIGAKAAIVGMSKAWAKELAPWGVTVNVVAPGGVWTDMVLKARGADFIRSEAEKVPLRRWAQAEEYAGLVALLASAEGAFITGQVVSPNGGASIVGF